MRKPFRPPALRPLAQAVLALAAAQPAPADYPWRAASLADVRIEDSFWAPRLETNRITTVWYDFHRCEETGRIDNFAKAGGLMEGGFKGIPFDDSDVYKVIEGAAYTLAAHPDPKLDAYLDGLIAKIAAAQEPDGYLYTARRLLPPEKMPGMSGRGRWQNEKDSHELYNVGHLYEAAAAHFAATGKRTLLDVAIRSADLVAREFRPGGQQQPPGHEGIEMGLVKLFRATGNTQYLETARFLVDLRGRPETHKLYGAQYQDHQPVAEQAEAVGHAVRAGYLYGGALDVGVLAGDERLLAAVDRLWTNVMERKLYLTGGIGARHGGEAFGGDYELPNASAYNETCAAIANALWNQRLFLRRGDARYVDVLERILYNGFLSGVAMSGDRFFYPNPLESGGGYARSPWFGCACCPVNVVRIFPQVPGWIYATRGSALYANLFIGSTARLKIAGSEVAVRQQTRYPWDGAVAYTISPPEPAPFAFHVRIPGWARGEPVPGDLYRYEDSPATGIRLCVNGEAVPLALRQGYAVIERTWLPGDRVELSLPMPVRRVLAHAAVKDNAGRFAVERGPLVYCAEGADNDGRVLGKVPGADAAFETQERPDLLGGIVAVRVVPKGRGDALTMIPYAFWQHRGATEMAVWLRTEPPAWSASHSNPSDGVEACFDGRLPRSSGDHDIPRHTWWDHRGSAEWVERFFGEPVRVSRAAVYWFDDTGRGACRVPASWRLLCRRDGAWAPVSNASGYGVEKDAFNSVTFDPVTTDGLRIEAQLQPGFSGGILEWQTGEAP